ncbi:hypothetical protein [Marininema halotolerans]|uniref:hypothetical protein n=1 Tax=Marininema halotolerans TaxID=1155944 RepID=UPI00112515A0|nr:hypothetical protein [Marininema halotolerans]
MDKKILLKEKSQKKTVKMTVHQDPLGCAISSFVSFAAVGSVIMLGVERTPRVNPIDRRSAKTLVIFKNLTFITSLKHSVLYIYSVENYRIPPDRSLCNVEMLGDINATLLADT